MNCNEILMAIILYKWQLEKSIEAWQMVYDEIYLHESSNKNWYSEKWILYCEIIHKHPLIFDNELWSILLDFYFKY